MTPAELGQRFLEPGLLFKAPIDQISLGMALVFGTAGLPHILMRFFTVPTAQAARVSVIWAMAIIGGFYVLTMFLGIGAATKVGADGIRAVDAGGNMAAPLLAQALGGGPDSLMGNFMLAFVAAVAFATIVAVVAGLVLAAASAMAHDLYVGVIRQEHVSPAEQVRAARIATVIVGAMAITIGILAKGQNVAHLVALAFAVASSANFPCVLLTLFWKRCNTGGIVLGMIVGTFAAIGLVLVSPNMTYPLAIKAAQEKIVATQAATLDQARGRPRGGDRRRGQGQAPGRDRGGAEGEGRGGSADQGDRQRPHVDRRAGEAAVRASQPRHHLDPAGLPRRDPAARCCTATSAPRTCGTSSTSARTPASSRPGRGALASPPLRTAGTPAPRGGSCFRRRLFPS